MSGRFKLSTEDDFICIDEEIFNMDRCKARDFSSGKPYPYLIVDNFLRQDRLESVIDEIKLVRNAEKSSDFMFARNKFEEPNFSDFGATLSALRADLVSEKFSQLISEIYGKRVFLDPDFTGGGIHLGGKGSFLDMHVDFNRHPIHRHWERELNLLLYLNPGYEKEWRGNLKLENLDTGSKSEVAPVANRLVIMLTKSHTLHGYDPINFPEGVFRTSLASYAYSLEVDPNESYRSTEWHPQSASKALLARVLAPVVRVKQAILGSRTAKRSQ